MPIITQGTHTMPGGVDVPYQSAGAPTAGADCVQTLVHSGSPTGGTWTFTDARTGGKTSSALVFAETQANVQAASDVVFGSGNTTVVRTGTTPNFTYTFTFTGNLAGRPITQMTANASLLTGGTPVITPGTTTAGVLGTFGQQVPRGALVTDTTNGILYVNTGTQITPVWTKVGTQT